MDFRSIDPTASFSISSTKSRNVYPFSPRIPVQIPGVRVSVSLGSFGYDTTAIFDEARPAHAAFVQWVESIEAVARTAVEEMGQSLVWTTSVRGFGGSRTMYLTLDQGTVVFDADGHSLLEESPCKIQCADMIAEIAGIWTGPTNAGLRWKIMQAKKREPLAFAPTKIAFVDDDEADAMDVAVGGKRSRDSIDPGQERRAPNRVKASFLFIDDE